MILIYLFIRQKPTPATEVVTGINAKIRKKQKRLKNVTKEEEEAEMATPRTPKLEVDALLRNKEQNGEKEERKNQGAGT